jgi:hypothetical protein
MRSLPIFVRRIVLGAAALGALALPASAHHGWAWTQDGFFELTGTITAIDYGNPHPTLDVEANGEVWRVDLATPRATASAGFMEDTAEVGDEVTAIGNRSRDESEKHMKAVRIVVKGKTYDVYPDRVPSN